MRSRAFRPISIAPGFLREGRAGLNNELDGTGQTMVGLLIAVSLLGSASSGSAPAPTESSPEAHWRACRKLLLAHVGKRITTTSTVSIGKAGWNVSYRGCPVDILEEGEAELHRSNKLFGEPGVSFSVTGVLHHRAFNPPPREDIQAAPESFFLKFGEATITALPPRVPPPTPARKVPSNSAVQPET
jgi:hypothetical protein